METALEDFGHHCRIERRLAPPTCSAYERASAPAFASCSRRGLKTGRLGGGAAGGPTPLPRRRGDPPPRPSSQARTVAALKGFFRFLVENEEIERNPAQVLRTPKKRDALPDVLDRRELARLLRAVERNDVWQRHFHGKRERDRLLLALFAYAGLRRAELLGTRCRAPPSTYRRTARKHRCGSRGSSWPSIPGRRWSRGSHRSGSRSTPR
jgi:site-specific recombinase XerD